MLKYAKPVSEDFLLVSVEGSSPRFQKRCFFGHRVGFWVIDEWAGVVFCWSQNLWLSFLLVRDGWGEVVKCQLWRQGTVDWSPIGSLHRAKMSPTNDKMHADREPWVALVAPGDFLALAKIFILELLEIQWRGCASVRYTAQCTLYM